MYKNGKILIGKNENKEANILLNMANRHGLITGSSGSGKTITLKVMAESFSAASVPVFMIDVKGDLSGTAFIGEENENVTSRVDKLGLEDFSFKKFPVTFLDVYGEAGHPVRTTVDSVGHRLMSKMLGLSEVQDSVLSIIYKIASDENKILDTLDDLYSMLIYVNNKRTEYSMKYGNLSSQSITTIQRNLLELQESLNGHFFGLPSFDIKDLRGFDVDTGCGRINILDAQELYKNPDSYVSMTLWLLNSIYDNMPEVGDLEKPKLVFFFDEAHLLFEDMPKPIVDQVIKIVKLIRSKGVGLYFITQTPSDIPDEILGQLGNRVQHNLRCFTKSDEKVVRAAADSYRSNPNFDSFEEIKNLGTGEALVSFLDEEGNPTQVEKVKILPPQSRMGTITSEERRNVILNSPIYGNYEEEQNRESAQELNQDEFDKIEQAKLAEVQAKEQAALDKQNAIEEKERLKKEKEAEKAKKNSVGYKLGKKVTNKAVDKVINKGLNSLFKGLFK